MTFLVGKKKARRRESQRWEVQRIWETARRLVRLKEDSGGKQGWRDAVSQGRAGTWILLQAGQPLQGFEKRSHSVWLETSHRVLRTEELTEARLEAGGVGTRLPQCPGGRGCEEWSGGEQKQPTGLGSAGRPSVGPPLPTPSLPPPFTFPLYLQGQLKHQCLHKPLLTTSDGVSHLQPHPTPRPKIKIPSRWVNKDRGLKKPISKLSAHKHQSHTNQSHFGCDVLAFL